MKFRLLIIFFLTISCSTEYANLSQKKPYSAKGFAYIYNDLDYTQKIIKGRMDNQIMQLSHQNLRTGALIKIINPRNNESIVLTNVKRIRYPDFYKILITKAVSDKLNLDPKLPLLEIIEIKKNKSFIAKKAKIFNEEKKIPSKAPVASVQISNISKNKLHKKSKEKPIDLYVLIASFYSIDTAKFLEQRIIKDIPSLNIKKLKIKKINNKKTQVILGPYSSVNLLKNDYIKLQNFGFEELNIFTNE